METTHPTYLRDAFEKKSEELTKYIALFPEEFQSLQEFNTLMDQKLFLNYKRKHKKIIRLLGTICINVSTILQNFMA
jgi:hypothetical protein